MTRAIRQLLRTTLQAETHLHPRSRVGQISICLVSPSRYQIGMSSLGFQTVYALLNNAPDILCERAFLPDRTGIEEHHSSRTPLLSLESQRPLSDFDVIAFSTSFEPDYLNISVILSLAGIPL
jgi:hypothetical protein